MVLTQTTINNRSWPACRFRNGSGRLPRTGEANAHEFPGHGAFCCARNSERLNLSLEGILRPLFFEEGVESGLGDGLVDLGFGTAGGDTADGLAIDLDGQAALIGKVVRKSHGFHVALFHVVSGVFRGTPVEGRVPALLLRPPDASEGGGL